MLPLQLHPLKKKLKKNESNSPWESTRVQNLFRYRPSGKYFARLKVGGKSIRKALGTDIFSVAELRLPDKIEENRKIEEARRRFGNGKMSFGDAVQIYRDKLEVNPGLKPKSKYYYRLMLDFITKSWPGVLEKDVRQIDDSDCKEWLVRYRQHYAPSVVNNSIGVLRAIFQEAVEVGARTGNPSTVLKRSKARPKKLKLPSRQDFPKFVQTIETGASRDSKNCADLVRFLAYSGMRVGESKHVCKRRLKSAAGGAEWRGGRKVRHLQINMESVQRYAAMGRHTPPSID